MSAVIKGTKFTGTVAKWFDYRGFGFVRRDSDGLEIFSHISEVAEEFDALKVGQRVKFEVTESERKPGHPNAIRIDVIN